MEGFQFGEQTQEAGTLLNREAGSGKGGADGGTGSEILPVLVLDTKRFGCSSHGGRRRFCRDGEHREL